MFHEILKLHQEIPFEPAVAKYFSDFPSVTAHTLRVWVAELDRSSNSSSNNNNNKTPIVDETKESVHCHQLFNVQITTIHQRIDQQTNELTNTANKLRNRFHEDRAFERDMTGGSGSGGQSRGTGGDSSYGRGDGQRNKSGGKKGGDVEITPFQNPINSRDPRNQSKGGPKKSAAEEKLQAPVRQNSRWQAETKQAAEPAAAAEAAKPRTRVSSKKRRRR